MLAKALEKKLDTSEIEAERRLYHLIEETCLNIVKSAQVFREELVSKLVNFSYLNMSNEIDQPVSSRTSDVVPSVKVISVQLFCLLKLLKSDEVGMDTAKLIPSQHLQVFQSDEACWDFVHSFVRHAAEEQLRRHFNNYGSELTENKEQLIKMIDSESESWLKKIINYRTKEL